jgi:hypothetical protein
MGTSNLSRLIFLSKFEVPIQIKQDSSNAAGQDILGHFHTASVHHWPGGCQFPCTWPIGAVCGGLVGESQQLQVVSIAYEIDESGWCLSSLNCHGAVAFQIRGVGQSAVCKQAAKIQLSGWPAALHCSALLYIHSVLHSLAETVRA